MIGLARMALKKALPQTPPDWTPVPRWKAFESQFWDASRRYYDIIDRITRGEAP